MKYTSKQVQILHPDHLVFNTMSSFEHLTPVLADRVKGWKAEGDRCQFEVHGIKLGFRFAELTPSSTIKLAGDDSATPFPFTMWFQIKDVTPDASQGATHSAADAAQAKIEADTRMRIVLDVELNTMMKMMIGGKIQQAIDGIADQIAHAFNQAADHQLTPQLTTIAG